ncbi:MAG: hypothetical protein M1838_006009 [Thelocarpon superellum]|nr:MAG: hypothetical protein M1838_006009 [Thelocarpon superellum]
MQLLALRGQLERVVEHVRYLVKDRHEKPNLKLYSALLLGHIDPAHGSVEGMLKLLAEMKEHGIAPDAGAYHNILKVLAVHPDYLVRDQILDDMRRRWFELNSDGWHDLVVGLLRDRNLELAKEKLEHMQREGMKVQTWLYDTFTYVLLGREEIDEAMAMLKYRIVEEGGAISANVWYALLDTASRCYHYAGTVYAWRKEVEPNHVHPADGICINVLNTASRVGDCDLAMDVFRILGNRSFRFELNHYEALLEAYLVNKDLKTALTILSIMKSAGLEPDEGTTRSLVRDLRQRRDRPAQAMGMLSTLHSENRPIPTAAVNAIIEASIALDQLDEGIQHYRALHSLCSDGPNTSTFNTIFRGCTYARRKDLALFHAAEMRALKIQPSALTLDRLVLVCLQEPDYDDAFRYMGEMTARKWPLRPGTSMALIRRCVEARDERVWDLIARRGMDRVEADKLRAWVRAQWEQT